MRFHRLFTPFEHQQVNTFLLLVIFIEKCFFFVISGWSWEESIPEGTIIKTLLSLRTISSLRNCERSEECACVRASFASSFAAPMNPTALKKINPADANKVCEESELRRRKFFPKKLYHNLPAFVVFSLAVS